MTIEEGNANWNIPSSNVKSTADDTVLSDETVSVPLNDWNHGNVVYKVPSVDGSGVVVLPQLPPMDHFFTLVHEVFLRSNEGGWEPPFMKESSSSNLPGLGSTQVGVKSHSTDKVFHLAKVRREAILKHLQSSIIDLDAAL